eukprot:CAMPEP_0113883556 /NCGR_PEP_ID=MMETSP0780_2-20120614/9682_1 /TAXON_ID=652834 /ORGANISM="Palpitomonas bilix" /LENGTH=636 /DNA_ID=CAMNT_0000870907 /DNA_START=132 /DNA_END=2038 /DNA_ORIENTATION=+ /assembly_acc=CAM_ASM_000599
MTGEESAERPPAGPSRKDEFLSTLERAPPPERRNSLARVEDAAKDEEEKDALMRETASLLPRRPPSAIERDGDWETAVADHQAAYDALVREFKGEVGDSELSGGEVVENTETMMEPEKEEDGQGEVEGDQYPEYAEDDDSIMRDDVYEEDTLGEGTNPYLSYEDTVTKYSTQGGALSTFKGMAERRRGTVRKTALRAIEEHELDLVVKEKLAQEAKERVTRENDKAIQLHNDCQDLADQIKMAEAMLAHEGKADSQDLQGMRRKYRNALEKAEDQEEVLQREDTYCAVAEREYALAEIELHKLMILKNELEVDEAIEREEMDIISKEIARREARAAKVSHKRRLKLQAEIEAIHNELAAKRVKQEEEAERGRQIVQDNLRTAKERTKKIEDDLTQTLENEHRRRANALLELKGNIEDALSRVSAKVQKRREKKAQREAQLQAEKEEILARGGNPYEVFLKRDRDRRVAKTKAKTEKNIAISQAKVTQQMQKEEVRYRAEKQVHRRHKEMKAKFQAEMGREAGDKRRNEYMMKTTNDGTTMVDPTRSLAHIHPSKVTTVKDWSFGLGKAAPKVMNEMAAKYPDVKPNPLFGGGDDSSDEEEERERRRRREAERAEESADKGPFWRRSITLWEPEAVS